MRTKRKPLKERERSGKQAMQMRRGCKKCRQWEKHFYRSHLDQRKVYFCKKMDASSFMKKMDLPNDFRRNFKGRMGESAELKGPSGNVWQVSVIKSAKKFTFQSGWKDFVIANDIEANDLLIFKYSGNSSFRVQIFDTTSGTEKVASLFARVEEKEVQKSSDSSIEVFEGPEHHMHRDALTISGSLSDSEYGPEPDSRTVEVPRGRASKEAGTSKEPNGQGKFKAIETEQISYSLKLSPAQKEKVLQLFQSIKPENDCFAILMQASMIKNGCRFAIPNKFVSEHLPQKIKEATLHHKGHTWSLSIGYRKTYRLFSAGWRQFVEDNNLELGDLCLFELVKENGTISFMVYISRNQI